MRKRFVCLFLALLLLTGGGSAYAASAGSSGDPLISLSYINDVFVPAAVSAFRTMLSDAQNAGNAQTRTQTADAMAPVTISAGGSVSMVSGQTVVLLSGRASISITHGSVVNASVGFEAADGYLNQYQRYIVCEDSAVTIGIIEDSSLTLSSGASVTQGDGKVSPFSDVKRGSWYFDDVISAYERGLVSGMTSTTYAPGGDLTVAQAVKLAACMHQLYNDGEVTLKNSSSGPWYRSYVDYALETGVISQEFADYDAAIERNRFVQVFYNALPEKEYGRLNSIPDGSIPDVAMSDESANEIYAFYRAGILTGYTGTPGYEEHAFGGDSTISRAEVAAIMNRMFDASTRRMFTLS